VDVTSLASMPSHLRTGERHRMRLPMSQRTAAVLVDGVAGLAAALFAGAVQLALPLAIGWVLLLRALSDGECPTVPRIRPVWTAGALVITGCWIAGSALPPSPARLLAAIAVAMTGSVVGRLACGRLARRLRVVVVAAQPPTDLGALGSGRLEVAGVCPAEPADVIRVLAAGGVDAVVVLPGPSPRQVQRLAWTLESAGTPLLVATGLEDVAAGRVDPLRVGGVGASGVGLVYVRPAPRRGWRGVAKQITERLLATTGLLVAAPFLLAIAVAIRCDSAGPALFRQTRVGRNGRSFTMLKFRTMAVDAEQRRAELASECDGPLFKVRADPRITRVGRFLRRYSLDELPQLINVVLGQMALVGPRPALPDEVAAYDADPHRRLAVAPGITGLWQVSGRSDLPWSEAVRLDLAYVDNWSLGLDLAIVVRTLGAVLKHRGAY
jgi:exopolysaccharide biosynthesis polyprenyl glycosylphosphotransferase